MFLPKQVFPVARPQPSAAFEEALVGLGRLVTSYPHRSRSNTDTSRRVPLAARSIYPIQQSLGSRPSTRCHAMPARSNNRDNSRRVPLNLANDTDVDTGVEYSPGSPSPQRRERPSSTARSRSVSAAAPSVNK